MKKYFTKILSHINIETNDLQSYKSATRPPQPTTSGGLRHVDKQSLTTSKSELPKGSSLLLEEYILRKQRGNAMFNNLFPTRFVVDHHSKERRYLTHVDGHFVAQQRLENGVFGPWLCIQFGISASQDGSHVITSAFSRELVENELHELNRLPIMWWGKLLKTKKVGVWWLVEYLPNGTREPNNGFIISTGQTGV